MATVKLLKKGHGKRAAAPAKKGAPPPGDFGLVDNGDATFTVVGLDAAGNEVDISAVATLDPPPSSDDTSIITVDPPSGMTSAMHAVGPVTPPGSPVHVTATATWIDGSVGPFSFTLNVSTFTGAATGIGIKIDSVTVR